MAEESGLREIFLRQIESQLSEWDDDIEELREEAYKTRVELELEHTEQIEVLRRQRETAQESLNALKEASEDAWEDLKVKVDKAVLELRQALDALADELKHISIEGE